MTRPLLVWCVLLVLLSGGAAASSPHEQPCPTAIPMHNGQCLLVPVDQAKKALKSAQQLDECRQRETIMRELHRAQLEAAWQDEFVERQRADKLAELLDKASKLEPPERPWYEHPAFVASVSAVAAAGVVLLSVWAAGSL